MAIGYNIRGKMNRTFLLVVVVALFVGLFGAYQFRQRLIGPTAPLVAPQPQEELLIKKISVLQGHEFDITLLDGRRVHAVLSVKTSPDAKEKVVAFINHSRKPRCVVLSKNSDFWTIDLFLGNAMMPESAQSLTEWLRQQNLVWE